jgi:uncharacterized protein (TIRG00374 family)
MSRLLRKPVVWLPVSVALLLFLGWRSRAWEAGANLGRIDPAPLVLAVALNAVVLGLWAVRSASLLRAADRPVGVLPLIPMTSFANTVNNLTPGSMGELIRLYLLRAHHGVEYPVGAAVVLIERVVAFGYLAGSALILYLGQAFGVPWVVELGALVALAGLPAVAYRLGLRPMSIVAALPVGRPLGTERWQRIGSALRRVDATIARLLKDPRRAGFFALTSAVIYTAYTAQLLLVGAAFGQRFDPFVAWGALGLGITAGVVSLLPFGLGSTDLVVVALLTAAGADPAQATAIVVVYRLVATLPLGLVGIASYALLSASLPDSGAGGAIAAASRALSDTEGPG